MLNVCYCNIAQRVINLGDSSSTDSSSSDDGLLGEDDDDVVVKGCVSDDETPAPAPKRSFVGRSTNVGDRQAQIPEGCQLRKYAPTNKPPYWHGILPNGVCDMNGHRNRQRSWHRGNVTELECIEEIQAWLWESYGGA